GTGSLCKGGGDVSRLVSGSTGCDCSREAATSPRSGEISTALGGGAATGAGRGGSASCADTAGSVESTCRAVTSPCGGFVVGVDSNPPSEEILSRAALAPSALYCCQANAAPALIRATAAKRAKLVAPT